MHPAFSVIFFTTASGAGYGLLALMGVLAPAGILPAERWFGVAGLFLALGLISAGLMSSTFHLGHPERAWRAVTQWRSSWLAREGVMAILTYGPALLFGLGYVYFEKTTGWWGIWGVFTALLAVITVACTSMIYRSLKTIHQWYNSFTIPAYLALGLMTGSIFLAAIAALFGVESRIVMGLPIVTILAGWAIKAAYWKFIANTQSLSTPQTATGLRGGPVKVVEWPHTEANYLNKEMGYTVARKHACKLKAISHLTAFALPLVLSVVSYHMPGIVGAAAAVLAAASVSVGVLVERWLFFAEAKHTVMLYYGAESA